MEGKIKPGSLRSYMISNFHKYDILTKEGYVNFFKDAMEYGGSNFNSVRESYRRIKGVTDNYVGLSLLIEKFGQKEVESWNRELREHEPKSCGLTQIKSAKNIINMDAENNKMGISEDELRQKIDLSFIILNKLREIPQGTYYMEGDFLTLAGVKGKSGYRRVLDSKEVAKYRGRYGGDTYYGHPESIARLKEEGHLT